MKRGFIRCVWGIYDNTHRITARRQKIDGDIKRIKECKFNEPFKVYVYGQDNFDRLKNDFDCIMVDECPNPFDLIKHQYRHKLELIKYAMEVDGHDEVVYMDWDCVPQKKLPDDFWEKCNQRGVIQGCLQQYRRIKCPWRKFHQRKVINGGWIFLKDKTIPDKVIEIWKTMPQDNDEPAWTRFIDDNVIQNWDDSNECLKTFWDVYETPFCVLWNSYPWTKEMIETKDMCFIHFI